MVICLAVILFILIRRFPDTAKLPTITQLKPVESEVNDSEIKEEKKLVSEKENVLSYSPEINNLIETARKLTADNKHQQAEDKLIEAIQLDIRCALAYSMLGDIYLHRKKNTEAGEAYRAAIHHDPKEPFAHYGLSLILEEAGRYNDAVAQLLLATRISDNNDTWYKKLGDLYINLRMFSKASMAYNKAAYLRPDYGHYKELALASQKKQQEHKVKTRV